MSEEKKKFGISDIIAVVGVIGVFTYYLGWKYWKDYYANLNVDSSLISMSFEETIASTWHVFTFVLILFASNFWFFNIKRITKSFNVIAATATVCMLIMALLMLEEIIKWSELLALSISIIVFGALINFALYKWYVVKFWMVNLKLFAVVLLILIYLLSLSYYEKKALLDAEVFKHNYTENIELFLKKDKLKVSGKFISYSNNKYVLLVEEGNLGTVHVYNEANISKVVFKEGMSIEFTRFRSEMESLIDTVRSQTVKINSIIDKYESDSNVNLK